jgi:photosystem II stability/assembly factor-like uncharacterized protein
VRLHKALRLLGGAILALSLLGLQAVADARATAAADGSSIALAFDSSTRTLLKATTDALYRSSDGGRSWVAVALPPQAKGQAIDSVAVSTRGKSVLYVAGPRIGVLRSEDGGRSWSARNKGLPGMAVTALATHADQPETVYAYVKESGIYRSEDGGLRWQLMDAGPRGGLERLIHSNMPGSMQTGWFFAASAQGVRRSMDCFCGWRNAGELGRAVMALAYDPRRPQNVYAATDEALFLSTEGGEKWTRVAAPAAGIKALVFTPEGVLYAAAGNGTLFRSDDGAETWERVGA